MSFADQEKTRVINSLLDVCKPDCWNDLQQSLPEYLELLRSFRKTALNLPQNSLHQKRMTEMTSSFLSSQLWEINLNFLNGYREQRKEIIDDYLSEALGIRQAEELIEIFEGSLRDRYSGEEYYQIGKQKIDPSLIFKISEYIYSSDAILRYIKIRKEVILAYEACGIPLFYTSLPIYL